jgi:Zn-dependent metalloprotease
VATRASLGARQAEDVAQRELLEQQLEPAEAARVQANVLRNKTSMIVYVDRSGKATLTWQVKIQTTAPLGQWTIFVNANRPVVVHALDAGDNARRRQTYSAGNTTDIPGDLLIDEGERSRDPVAQAAHDGAGKVYDYYFNTFKRDAYDGQGSPMVSTVHFGSDPQDQENAAWISEAAQMIYGDGGRIFKPLAYGLDVVGHEFTHGVVDNTAQLVYEAQSGALNESYADVFGVLISGTDWEVGRDVVKSPPYPLPYLRSLKDPNAEGSYDPNDPLTGVGQPATVDEYANLPISRRFDNGGVHINSGIPNRAAYLVAQALGKDKMQQVYYRTMTQYLSPESDFLDAANATARAATDLYGANEANAVRTAFGQIGINIGGADTSPPPPATPGGPQVPTPPAPAPTPPQVPAGCTDAIVAGSFESDAGWTQVTAKGSTTIIDTELPHSGARSAWLGGTDEESFQYIYQDVNIPANATTAKLSYYRLIHEETTGLLGAFSSEAKFSAVIANTQGDTLLSLEEIGSSQGDDAWHQATFDVSRLGGKTVRLVFAAENPLRNVSSMFVDDVALAVCTTGAGPAAPQPSSQDQVYIQGILSDADTGRGINGAQIFILRPGVSASQAAADDNIADDEVLTSGVADADGMYQTEAPVPRNQTYSAIVLARGYRPILADEEVQVPADSENPYPVDATLRRSR